MTTIQETIKKRFDDLEAKSQNIRLFKTENEEEAHTHPATFYDWAVSVMEAIYEAFGKESPHYQRFETEMNSISNNFIGGRKLDTFIGIFHGAKSDIDHGYLINIQNALSGEIYGDLIVNAKASLAEGNYSVATVLSCAALENALKHLAQDNSLPVNTNSIGEIVSALRLKGLISGAQKTLLEAISKIRDKAMHAEWSEFTPQEANNIIEFVERFLLKYFS